MKIEKSEDVQDHVFALFNLLVVILKRRALFRAFETNLKNKDMAENILNNGFASYYITDYTRGQLIDLRKFFETDRSSYRISDLIDFIGDANLSNDYKTLNEMWSQKFKDQVDKQIAHIDRNSEDVRKHVEKIHIDFFIDSVDALFVDLITKLKQKGTLAIQEELRNPEGYFLKVQQAEEFKRYLEWTQD